MTRLDGQIALVTGATAGIGLVTARRLAEMGAEVFLVGRDASRLEAAVRTIRVAAPEARLETLQGDLSLMSEVRRVAAAFHARHDRLDILVNNAGAVFDTRRETDEGLEMTFALNHMSYFLLTHLLLDTLKAAPAGRIVAKTDLLRVFLGSFPSYLQRLESQEHPWILEALKYDRLDGSRVQIKQGSELLGGMAQGWDASGRLLLRDESGRIVKISSGQVLRNLPPDFS